MVAAGVVSRDPLKRIATHSTTVPLYCGSAGMVRVYTVLPSSLTEPDLMSGNRPTDDPFTLQIMSASEDVWRHLHGSVTVPSSTVTLAGISANPVDHNYCNIWIRDFTLCCKHNNTCHKRGALAYKKYEQGASSQWPSTHWIHHLFRGRRRICEVFIHE